MWTVASDFRPKLTGLVGGLQPPGTQSTFIKWTGWTLTMTLVVMIAPWLPSVLWRCWLGGRKGIQLVKTEWWGAGMVICLERGADLHMAQPMPLPLTVSCFSKIQIGSTFLVPAHLGSPGKRAVKRMCVCVCFCKGLRLQCFDTIGWAAGRASSL